MIDLTFYLTPGYITHWYVDIAGLDYMAQVMTLDVIEPAGIIGGGIPWRRVDWDASTLEMEKAMGASGRMEWDGVRKVVNGIQQAPRRNRMPGWWSQELCRMRADIRRLSRDGRKVDYKLARKIYRASLWDTMDQALGKRLANATDPDIFRTIDALEL